MGIKKNQDMQDNWINGILSQKEIEDLSLVVAEQESKTVGEIVPVIVQRSINVGHVYWLLCFLFVILFLVISWEINSLIWMELSLGINLAAIAGIFLLSYPLARTSVVQRFLTFDSDEVKAVLERAELEFYRNKLKKTSRGAGVLIFVSWCERRAVILADENAVKFFNSETLTEITQEMTRKFKKGNYFEGLSGAIQKVGEVLIQSLPKSDSKVGNELSNALVIKKN